MADVQKIGDVIRNLTAIRKKYGNVPAVYSCDDEGNSYQHVYYTPTPGKLGRGGDFDSTEDKEEVDCVCIN